MPSPEIYGLVLAGGRSRRMRTDKALLPYQGTPQLERAMQLLAPLVGHCFVSIREDQRGDSHRAGYSTIVDVLPELGPIGGIQAALRAHPDKAWLVLACDLPFLTRATLEHLIARRAPAQLATAYRSSHDGLPEPLCAIFEPASRAAVEAWIEQGRQCPRALLAASDVRLLEPLDAQALDNINTPEQYSAAAARLPAGAANHPATVPQVPEGPSGAATHVAGPLKLRVRYFAALREQAGRGVEELETQARTPLELYRELARRRGLALAPEHLRVAINDEFGEWRARLADGDTVAFLPPVAGG